MKNAILSVFALCAMFVMPNDVSAESCNARTGVCIGTPTAKPCGHPGQLCCGSQGYDYDCLSSNYTCNPAVDQCVPLVVECIANCYTISKYYYETFYVWGYETQAQIQSVAIQYCDSVPAQYMTYSCAY